MEIGILGGSFNPVHNGHLRLGIEVLEQVGLDRVDFVPAAVPPHKQKQEVSPFSFRRRLLEKALEGRKGTRVNPVEGYRSGPSYTVDTLTSYQDESPEAELHFIMGGRDFLTLTEWHQWQSLLEQTHFVVVSRQGISSARIQDFVFTMWPKTRLLSDSPVKWGLPNGRHIVYLTIPRLDISSSMVRDRLRQGRSLAALVPESLESDLESNAHLFADET
jgi:nicotinate-nucleotide adenylyltransferase